MTRSTLTKCLRRSLAVWAPLCLSLTVSAQTYRSPFETKQAYQKLAHAKIFNFGGVGWGLQITPEEKAFRVVFESPDSVRLFQRLINDANDAGQLYALFGLHLRDTDVFQTEAARLEINEGMPERSDETIAILKGKAQVARGCLISFQDLHVVVRQIANGDWDSLFWRGSRWPNLDSASR